MLFPSRYAPTEGKQEHCGVDRYRRPGRSRAAVVEKYVEVAWSVAEGPEEQRGLSSMMHTMNGGVMHQFPEWHGVLRAIAECEFHNAVEILVSQIRQELP